MADDLEIINKEIVPSDEKENNPFDLKVFDEISFSDILKQSFEAIDKAEAELYELYEISKIEAMNGTPEKKLYFGSSAKEFLEVISQQNDSRAKMIQAATNIIKSSQPKQNNIGVGINMGNESSDKLSLFSNIAKDLDPLKKIDNIAKSENFINDKIVIIKHDEEKDDVDIIHSPSYLKNKIKNE